MPDPINEMTPSPASSPGVTSATATLRDFSVFKGVFTTLNEGFVNDIQADQNDARKLRRLDIDVEGLKQTGQLETNDTYIGARVIDTNVKQKMPSRMAYLKSANRLAIFEPEVIMPNAPPTDCARLESEFWRVLTYTGWEIPFIRVIDGAEFVGYDWLEVLYTPEDDRPGAVSINHVGRDNLLFDLSVHDIQDSKMVARRYPMTLVTLTELAKEFNFPVEDVIKIREKITNFATSATSLDVTDYNQTVFLFRCFFKEGGQVYSAWYQNEIDHFLSEPAPFYNGVDKQIPAPGVPVPGSLEPPQPQMVWQKQFEFEYPYQLVIRTITEDSRIAQTVGSSTSDYFIQEAACSLWSSLISKAIEAGYTMWSPDSDPFDKTGAPKQLSLKVQNGQIWDRSMRAFHSDFPDPGMPKIIDELQQLNANQTGQIAWGVAARKGDRKTATEIDTASQMQGMINSSEVLMLSISMCFVWNAAWKIIQSQALKGTIVFCPLQEGVNDVQLVGKRFRLKSAGDADFVQKQQTIQNMQQDWPMIQATGAAQVFMMDYIRLRYPDQGSKYIVAIANAQQQQAQDQAGLIAKLQALVKALAVDSDGKPDADAAPYQAEILQLVNTPAQSQQPGVPPQAPNAQQQSPSPQQSPQQVAKNSQ